MQHIPPEQALIISGVEYFDKKNGEWLFVRCCYCKGDADKDIQEAKGRINATNGAYSCHRCNQPSSVLKYIAHVTNKPIELVKLAVDSLNNKEKIPTSLVDDFHRELLVTPDIIKKLNDKHGITLEEIKKFKLGWNRSNERVQIPIFVNDKLVNFRQYSYTHDDKVISTKGHGGIHLFNAEACKGTEVYIAEGEFKAILMTKYGLPACAPTNGAKKWSAEFNDFFTGKDVIIVYDVDEPGRIGSNIVCNALYGKATTVRNIFLNDVLDIVDSRGKHNGDITNYFVDKKKTVDDFRILCLATPIYEPPKEPELPPIDLNIYPILLSEAGNAKYYHKQIKTNVVVSAKDTSPYVLPKVVRVTCPADQDYCGMCHVATHRGYEFKIGADEAILQFVNKTDSALQDALKLMSGVYKKCNKHAFINIETQNVEELRCVPQVAIGHNTGEMVVRRVFAVGHGVESNASYETTAKVCINPDDQHAVLVANEMRKSQDDISQFELKHDLTLFQPSEWTVAGIEAKLTDIYEDLEHNVTKIYNREALHIFYDLIVHSLLYIPFQGDIKKGWVDALCIGDSGQGKSETAIKLMAHYKAGERVDCKSSSVAGLVGGLQESNGRWFITWGQIPLNDRRLVFLEEVKGASIEVITKLTDMRSSGIAEIVKIERAKTNARTRLGWISNPRGDRQLSTYNYGVDAIRELVGSLEDIRRFDMCIAVASGDVSESIINTPSERRRVVPHSYTSELCSHLVMWCWSRKESEIRIDRDAEHEILAVASRMGNLYSAACPIVEPSDQRIKIVRLAGALAGRTYSCDDNGYVVIRKCHVEYIERFLNKIYADKALGYLEFSKAQLSETKLIDRKELATDLRKIPNAGDTIRGLIESDSVDTQSLMDFTEWMREEANTFLGFLVRKQALRKLRRGGYRKTPAFIELLKELDREGLKNETLAVINARGTL